MGRVIHFEIHADDVDRAEAFYTKVFGWQSQAFGGPVDYRLLNTGPKDQTGIDGALMKRRDAISDSGANAYVCTIQVDDIEAMEKAIPEAGGEQVVARQEVPEVGQLSYFRDTEGNVFGALQPAS
jgi:predicted enzyme related to lactoylglutathione lyase